jgi:pyrimidine-specific ribonucleoside hydrolase
MEKINSGFYALWDDLLPVYLQKRDLFISDNIANNIITAIPQKKAGGEIKERIIEILKLKDNRENKVFSQFPQSPELFRDDVSIYSEEIISNYGISEWRAVTLTNELHGHLGIYAVVGAKMGIRVREYFAIGLDDLMIVSFAGKTPPLSCLNDGLQVSTGATLGHGLIEISDSKNKGPYSDFTFKNKKIRVSLKDAYRQQVIIDIKKGIADYGNLTPEYWAFIRQLAIRYWKEWDRNNIFEIDTL